MPRRGSSPHQMPRSCIEEGNPPFRRYSSEVATENKLTSSTPYIVASPDGHMLQLVNSNRRTSDERNSSQGVGVALSPAPEQVLRRSTCDLGSLLQREFRDMGFMQRRLIPRAQPSNTPLAGQPERHQVSNDH